MVVIPCCKVTFLMHSVLRLDSPRKTMRAPKQCPRSQLPGLMAALFIRLVYEAEAFLCQSLLMENTCLALAGSF